jgi:hypothetical protein
MRVVHKQIFLPGFPEGAQRIGDSLSILEKEGTVTYWVGTDNYFSHPEGDKVSRRFALASLIENGHVRICDLEEAPLCIPHRTLMNWVTQYRQQGPASFYRQKARRRPSVMTAEIVAESGRLLADGMNAAQVARQMGIQGSTLRKAVQRQAIPKLAPKEKDAETIGSTKTERSRADAEAANAMGTACTRADERIAAAIGLAGCAIGRFEAARDVQMGGLLAGLPALCANGLLSGLGKYLSLPKGFYSALHILLVLGFMALGRIRRPEGLRHIPPGELGKVLGLDRVPEVRTLREKISILAVTGKPEVWMKELSKTWMANDPDEAGYLYVDGHVRVYCGSKANLPRRFVSRERLCLRGTTDYWVNDAVGRPFFVVSKAVTDGLADTLLNDIVPDLLSSVPQQPSAEELDRDSDLHRFVIVFDREGATHSLLADLWGFRIGALTYRKNVKDLWPEAEFVEHEVPVPGGGSTRMMLARRETRVSSGKKSIPVIEVRRLTPTGHQTAVITTARRLGTEVIAGRMFSRWCQENFFGYMVKEFDLDGLIEYGVKDLPGTLRVINPEWRDLDKTIKKKHQTIRMLKAELMKHFIGDGREIQKKAESVEVLQAVQDELEQLRLKRQSVAKKVTIESLPADQRPTALRPLNKMLSDTVKMIAYRAETALVGMLRCYLTNEDEARALARELFVSSADIEPDNLANTLTIRIHHMATPVHNRVITSLLNDLTAEAFSHPETGARMIYTLA